MAQVEKNITAWILQSVFPEDTVWNFNVKEIVGYSISKNLHFVIDDGMCCSEDGKWVLSIYRPTDSNHWQKWLPTIGSPYSVKYPDDGKFFEEYVGLGDSKEMLKLFDTIQQL